MSATSPRRFSPSAVVAAALLVAFSATGLMAGGVTYAFFGGRAVIQRTSSPTTAQTSVPAHTPTPASNLTPHPTAAITTLFTLSLSAGSSLVRPGQKLQITVMATSETTGQSIAGLACQLEAPEDGAAPLLRSWPEIAVTNAAGQATWEITVPDTAPGTYGIGVTASGARQYRYHAQANVTVASAG
ncbi:MAG: hypothetical protein IVW57_00745 [Ktedonobacterales bacterium]|nr:hypothetical protein [Ktedonobacterales bacterium]